MEISEDYIRAQMFFLHCAFCSGILDKDSTGKIIPNHEESHIGVANMDWLNRNSPTYFEYWPKSGRVQFKTPNMVLQAIWREVGLL